MESRVPARLSAADGRRFGLTLGAAFLALAALLYWWRHREVAAAVAGSAGAFLVLAGVLVPTRLGPLERGWMALARLLSKVTTPVFMSAVFFLVITPIGLVMRLAGRRPLVHAEREGGYWAAPGSGGRSDLEHQF